MKQVATVVLQPIISAGEMLAWAGRTLGLAVCSAFSAVCIVNSVQAAELFTGDYSFSDELGGFELLSVSGTGSSLDPVVIIEVIHEVAPIALIVRRHNTGRMGRGDSSAALTIEKIVINRSVRVWGGFEIELQEHLGRPSVYTDGLSFNQLGPRQPDVNSDSFVHNNRIFEPSDRIRFESGFVDPEATARFKITITDPTPDLEFYIVQDPQLLMSALPLAPGLALTLD